MNDSDVNSLGYSTILMKEAVVLERGDETRVER